MVTNLTLYPIQAKEILRRDYFIKVISQMALPIAVRFNSSVQVDKQFLIPSFDDHVYLLTFCKLQLLQPPGLLSGRASYFQAKHISKSRPTRDWKDKTHPMKYGEH